jgi:hypothetical protein
MKKNIYDFKMFVDCGAPSLYNKLSRNKESNSRGIMGSKMSERKFDDYSYTTTFDYNLYLADYAEFILENKDKIDVYSNLDVINNPELTYRNQQILEEMGINPIPVFHLGNDPKWLDMYIKKYPYIAIGGLVPNPTRVLIPWLDKLFKEYILDSDGYPKVKLHGFACTSLPLMKRFPWYSVDSATCRKLANFGLVVLPDLKKENPIKTFRVSSRNLTVQKENVGFFSMEEASVGNHLDNLTSQERKSFDLRCEQYGTTIQELGDSIIKRVVWNYLCFSEVIQITVPRWPWSMTTRNPLIWEHDEVEDDYMTFYFAGILSKSEEAAFWEGVSQDDVTKLKGTLRSFFYKENARYVLSLKK